MTSADLLSMIRELPWPIPVAVLLEMRDEELDRLAAVPNPTAYWRGLNGIVSCIESRSTTVGGPSEEAA